MQGNIRFRVAAATRNLQLPRLLLPTILFIPNIPNAIRIPETRSFFDIAIAALADPFPG
jgi:hypothetical protein